MLSSNFPGSETRGIPRQEEKELLDGAFGDTQEAVASVSCVAALRDKSRTEDKAFVQGIERFMDAMDGEVYTALFLAEPVSAETQAEIRSGYENLYSSLSPFRKSTWSYSENQSTAVMESLCSGTSHTISDTVSTTTTNGTSQSSSVTDGTQKTKGVSGGINGGVGSSSGTSVTKVSPVAGGIAGILGLGGAVASVAIPVAGAVISRLAAASGIPERELPQLLNDLNTAYQKSGHALQVLLLEKTAQLCTVERYAPYIQAALEQKRTLPLTPAALEVLTIAAYHQPVTKRFIAHVRGIDSSTLVNTLVERGLLEEGERLDLPGKPIAYRTTPAFLRCFGLSSLDDLPPLPEIPVPEQTD